LLPQCTCIQNKVAYVESDHDGLNNKGK